MLPCMETSSKVRGRWGDRRTLRAYIAGGEWRRYARGGPPIPTLRVNGAELYHEVRVDGAPVLLILGMTGDAGHRSSPRMELE
jgi:hypothetical protein